MRDAVFVWRLLNKEKCKEQEESLTIFLYSTNRIVSEEKTVYPLVGKFFY